MDVVDKENVKPRSRTLPPKGKEYQMELVAKDLKHVRSRLANHLCSFETLMREMDINGTKAELQKTDEVVAHLQTTVERQMDLFEETEETKKADLLDVLTAELESVKQVKKEVEKWLEENRTLENEGSKTNGDEEVSALSDMIQVIPKPDVSATKDEKKERNQGEQEVVRENGNGESNMQITIEVMRLQMKLDNQVSLFDDLLDLKDVAMIKRELDRLEVIYKEMTGKVKILQGKLSDDDELKVTDIMNKSEVEVKRIQELSERALARPWREENTSGKSKISKEARNKEADRERSWKKYENMQLGTSGDGDSGFEGFLLGLENQRSLINDLLGTTNMKMMSKELEALDKMYDKMKEYIDTMDKTSTKGIETAMEKLNEEDKEIAKTKRQAVKWMKRQRESEKGSRRSYNSKSSFKTKNTDRTGHSSQQSKYKRDIEGLHEQLKRNQRRLTDQHVVVEDLLKENDPDTLDREIDMMERFYQNTIAVIENLRSVVLPEEGNRLLRWMEEEDMRIQATKREYVRWLVKQEEIDNRSVVTRSSRKTVSDVMRQVEKEKEDDECQKREKLEKAIGRARSKFEKQKLFCHSIKNVNLLCKEIHKLEDLYKEISDATLSLNELLTREEAEERLEKLEQDEASIFNMVKQMTKERRASEQEEQSEGMEMCHEEPKSRDGCKYGSKESKLITEEVSRIQARLENQVGLVEDLLLSEDRSMLDRELQTLDRVYDDFVAAASNLRKMVPPKESEKVSKLIDEEDALVFKVKKSVSKWLVESRDDAKRGAKSERNPEKVVKSKPADKEFKNKEEETGKEDDTANGFLKLNQLMIQTLKQQAAPDVELDTFSGNPLEYHYFVENFKDAVESLIDDPKQRLMRLLKFTDKEAKDLIKHCVYESRESCYSKAMALLEKEYGNPYKVSSAYLEKLNKWPQIKSGDAAGLKSLYRFLLQCDAFREKGIGDLDSPFTIRNVQLSLPINLQDKWTFRVGKIRKMKGKEAAFRDMVEFIEEEALALNDPIYSRQGFKDKSGGNVKTYLTIQPKVICPLCKDCHDLDNCQQFKEKNTRDKKDFLFKAKLCFACYGKEHRVRDCTNKRTCNTCGKEHPTSLHDVTFKVSAIHGEEEDGGLCIVLVRMSHTSCPEKEVEVYAMLDECSNGNFVNEGIVDYLSDEFKKPTQVTVETLNVESTSDSYAIEGLLVKGTEKFAAIYPTPAIPLPKTYTKSKLPMGPEDIPRAEEISKWGYLQEVAESLSDVKDIPLGLLIGSNCKKALEPMQVISSQCNGPYAKRTRLGWCVIGSTNIDNTVVKCNKIRVCTPLRDMTGASRTSRHVVLQTKISDNDISNMLQDMWKSDFIEREGEEKGFSKEDNQFVKLMKENIRFKSGRYELPLPLRTMDTCEAETLPAHSANLEKTEIVSKEHSVEIVAPEEAVEINKRNHLDLGKKNKKKYVVMPDSRGVALQRLRYLKRRMLKDKNFRNDYSSFMGKLFTHGYARKVSKDKVNERSWVVPHHGVYHPVKKKFRGVFDCSATKERISLNSKLIQGPDPANSLLGVLFRFRSGLIGFMADIETMYYQVAVPEEHSKFLRFYWWEDEDLSKDPVLCEMCVHPFGAVSSKGCVIFALHQTALDNMDRYGTDALETLLHDFYVDDLLKSLDSEEQVIDLIKRVRDMCSAGNFNLTKFICGNENVIKSIPPEKRANKEIPLNVGDNTPGESALGMQWYVDGDDLGFCVDLSRDDGSRRGCLSTIHRIKDLLGLVAPFLLKGRKLLQKLAVEAVGWEGCLPPKIDENWKEWRNELLLLNKLKVRRCYRSKNFGKVVNVTLHCFSDACFIGYGVACYLRFVDSDGNVEVALVMGKSRVSPMKPTTVPRLELTAAAVNAKIGKLLIKELKLTDLETFYWVDNKVVLGYICNPNRRYRIFVANRVKLIEDLTPLKNWRYVKTKDNPADYASRGISPSEEEKVRGYFGGPGFLISKDESWRKQTPETEELEDDVEVKQVKVVNLTRVGYMQSMLEIMEERISSWHRMKRVVAWANRFVKRCRKEIQEDQDLSVEEINAAETMIIKWVQARSFESDLKLVRGSRKEKVEKKQGNLWRLNPFIDGDGVMRVGGRISQAVEEESVRFPAIFPKQTIISRRLIEWHHRKIEHRGKHTTICEIREAGYWVVNGNKEAGAVVHACVRCRWLRGKVAEQMMADLPWNRTTTEPPFTYCGVDFFGWIKVKEGRKAVKRYGVLFTCLSMRAVHIELASSLETDSFIQALRRFVARRGAVRELRCDNGSNLTGAENELREAMAEIDHEKVRAFMTEQGGDWMVWEKNTPAASHMGGVWERQIRTVKGVLTSLVKSCPRVLDEDTLQTFLVEAEGIVNSRPLTIENLFDPDSTPLTPNRILTMKSRFVSPPPGAFQEADVYCRKRWRISQHLANAFWSRWRKEYLQLQQVRQKWAGEKRNARVGDLVLLKEEGEMQGHWPMARVVDVHPSKDGLVRSVSLTVRGSVLKRPIHKTVLLLAADT